MWKIRFAAELAEYPANGAVGSPQKEFGYRDGQLLIVAQTAPFEIRWLVADHLGSPRINDYEKPDQAFIVVIVAVIRGVFCRCGLWCGICDKADSTGDARQDVGY